MEAKLTPEQDIILKRTRDILGDVRDTLATTSLNPDDREALADSIRQLDELFLLVVAGEFNAGKSSFINALLGHDGLLQEGVTPTTSQIYLLKYGSEISQTPREKGVWVQTAPVEMLETINIVDTPGTNAILREHEALTADFIPRSDLVLFLTSADRPFSESERAFLERIKGWGKKIVLVINKIDILDDPAEAEKVVAFVRDSAQKLVGEIAGVFSVSARKALKAKTGEPQCWSESGFEPLETFIEQTLDSTGRFRLKLLNPLGVGRRLVNQQLDAIQEDWELLENDQTLLHDIENQMHFYDEDMQRNFDARLSEVDSLLLNMEKRGNEFFDDTLRIGRIPDLIKREYIQNEFERVVVADTPQLLEQRVGEIIDWLVEQDLRQWTAVSEHLSRRRQDSENRIVGQTGPREGTLAYDRQRLVDSIGKETRRTIESYDRSKEAARMASTSREAVAGLAAGGIGVGLGATLLIMATTAWVDWTGAITGLGAAALGLFIFPSRRRKAKSELSTSLEDMRTELLGTLRNHFEREMRRGTQRIEDTVAPFSRFVRAEKEKIEGHRNALIELEAHIEGLLKQAEAV
ncbi:MAG: dynamin family protein [Ardenticatenaceae bacterium]|nr:dynamin family protein [Ardenticatenaceae bacterium]